MTKQRQFALRVFAVPNPDGEREFYWIKTPEFDLSEEELNELTETEQWHGPFASEQEAREDQYRVAEDEEYTIFPDQMTLAFQPDKSTPGKYVFHAVGDGRLIAVITVDREATTVRPSIEGELPEWASRQLADGALNILEEIITKAERDGCSTAGASQP
jgi:hypothetical protein